MVNINVCVTKGRNSKRSPIKRDSSGYVKVNSFISISLFELLLTIFCFLMQCRCRQVDDDISSTRSYPLLHIHCDVFANDDDLVRGQASSGMTTWMEQYTVTNQCVLL